VDTVVVLADEQRRVAGVGELVVNSGADDGRQRQVPQLVVQAGDLLVQIGTRGIERNHLGRGCRRDGRRDGGVAAGAAGGSCEDCQCSDLPNACQRHAQCRSW
jgi:hypothetical protein